MVDLRDHRERFGDCERDNEGETSGSTRTLSSRFNVEKLVVWLRTRSVRLRWAEKRMLLRHRLTALVHLLCAALAS